MRQTGINRECRQETCDARNVYADMPRIRQSEAEKTVAMAVSVVRIRRVGPTEITGDGLS